MSDPDRVLYLAPTPARAEAVESRLAATEPTVEISTGTAVSEAVEAIDDGSVGRVVVDEDVADAAPDLRAAGDLPVETLAAPRGASEAESARALADRIAGAATTGGEGSSAADVDFRAVARAVSDAILVIDGDSVVRFANPSVEDVFGYAPEELLGESLTRLMPDRVRDRHREGIERYLREGERALDWEYVELPGRHRDGRELALGVSFSEFVRDGERRFAGVIRDVTEQRRRSEELERRVRQQEAVAELSRSALGDRDLDELFDEAVATVADTLDHDYAKVLELRPEREELLLRAGVGWREGAVGTATVGVDRDSQAGYTLRSAAPIVVEDLDAEDRFSGPELLTSHGVSSGISAIVGSVDDPWGVLGVHDGERRSYADHDVQFVRSVARILTTAIRQRERERRLEQYEAMLEAVGDGVYALDADSRFVAVNDAYCRMRGLDRAELLGETAAAVVGESPAEEANRIQKALESGDDAPMKAALPTADGDTIPVEARISPLPLGEETGRVGVVRDVSDRKRREEKLTSLHDRMQSLAETETDAEVCDIAIDAGVGTLEFEYAAVVRYESGSLVPATRAWSGDAIDEALVGPRGDGLAWEAFAANESRSVDDFQTEGDAEAPVRSVLAVPLGRHGAFLAGDPEPDAFDETDRSLAELLCANVTAALDRAEREATLRDRRDELQAKNSELERANRLNEVIRKITRALIEAATREELLRSVCERLTETGPYRFAWFGEYDRAIGEVVPKAQAGVEEGYLENVTVSVESDDPEGRGPAGRAIRTGEPQVQNDIFGDPPFEPWREQALKRGYRSSASVPVAHDGHRYGVLNIYAGEPDVFDDTELAVLAELGDITGYALNALERKQALVSDRSVDLDFRVRGSKYPILRFVSETDGEFEFESVVQRGDGNLHLFFTVRGSAPDETLAFAERLTEIENTRLVSERDGEYRYEGELVASSFLASLVNRGAVPQSLTASDGEGRVVVRVPASASARTFVELFESAFDEVELVARRERDEPVMSEQAFASQLESRLTERQREVLEVAYFSGFFEWPRDATAEEIAAMLGVSQPTVSRHVRAGERALFSLYFEESR